MIMENDIFVVEKTKLEEVECDFEDAIFFRIEGETDIFPITNVNCIKHYRKTPPVVELHDVNKVKNYCISKIKFFKTVSTEPEMCYTLNLNKTTLCKIQAILSTMRWYNNDTMDSELRELSEHIEEVAGVDYYKTECAFAKKDGKGGWIEVRDVFVVDDDEFYAR